MTRRPEFPPHFGVYRYRDASRNLLRAWFLSVTPLIMRENLLLDFFGRPFLE